jgi:hypothetical protein
MANLITAGIFYADALKTPLSCAIILLLLIGVYIFNMRYHPRRTSKASMPLCNSHPPRITLIAVTPSASPAPGLDIRLLHHSSPPYRPT